MPQDGGIGSDNADTIQSLNLKATTDQIIFDSTSANKTTLKDSATAARTLTLPDKTDTLAVLSDVSAATMSSYITRTPGSHGPDLSSFNVGSVFSTTSAEFFAFELPFGITINKFTYKSTSGADSGTADFVIYAEDGQSQEGGETFTILAGGGGTPEVYTLSTPITLSAGIFYWGWVTNAGADSFTFNRWELDHGLNSGVSGEPIYAGSLTVTAGTMPATFDPTALTADITAAAVLRFD